MCVKQNIVLRIKMKQATFEKKNELRKSNQMNTYFIRRLLPFYAIGVFIEVIFTAYEIYISPAELSFTPLAIIKSLGISITTTTSAFLILMSPFMFYLVILPHNLQNTQSDKIISALFFFGFSGISIMEEMCVIKLQAELTSWQNFQTALTPTIMITASIVSFLLTFLLRKSLTTPLKSPQLVNRIFQGCMYALISIMIFNNTHIDDMTTGINPQNDKIARENTFMILDTSLKEISKN